MHHQLTLLLVLATGLTLATSFPERLPGRMEQQHPPRHQHHQRHRMRHAPPSQRPIEREWDMQLPMAMALTDVPITNIVPPPFDEAGLPPTLSGDLPGLLPDQSNPFSKGDFTRPLAPSSKQPPSSQHGVAGGPASASEDPVVIPAIIPSTPPSSPRARSRAGPAIPPVALPPPPSEVSKPPPPATNNMQPHPIPSDTEAPGVTSLPTRDPINSRASHCKSGTFPFTPERVYLHRGGGDPPADLDPVRYDYVVDYHPDNVELDGHGGMRIKLTKSTAGAAALGSRVSTVRYLTNAQFSVQARPVAGVPGAITSFITMSKGGDELDFEWVSGEADASVQSNVFARGVKEYSPSHSGKHALSSGVAGKEHVYSITWTNASTAWAVDGKVVRSITPDSERSVALPPPAKWYPGEPSQIQFGLWDAGTPACSCTCL
jgi:hypothetical protein